MEFDWQNALGALAGGALGVALGALPAFILTGFLTLAGVVVVLSGSDYDFLGVITFGPVLGPHVTFAGGIAGAAFAARMGRIDSAKDIATPLAGLAEPVVHLVGGLFGLAGYLAVEALSNVGITANNTDVIALVVGLSNVAARLIFGRTGAFGTLSPSAQERGRWVPDDENVWVQWQQGWREALPMGAGSGVLAAWLATQAGAIDPELSEAIVPFAYGLSAISLIYIVFDRPVPVTHHMTLMGALGGVMLGNVLWGALFGMAAAAFGELFSRLFLIHGDTFIDPPAWSITAVTTLVIVADSLIG